MFNQTETCIQHVGQVTPKCIDILDNLIEKQLLAEISILSIRQMRRVKSDSNFRMEKYSEDELVMYIKNALQPQKHIHSDIDILLKEVL